MKEKIVIPPQYVDIIKKEAASKGISADEVVESAIKKIFGKEQDRCRVKRRA